MSFSSSLKASLGGPQRRSERRLAGLLGLGLVLGLILSPLGVETRRKELRSPAVAAFFIVVGILAPLAGLVLLFKRPKLAAVLAIVDAALLVLASPADQAKVFFKTAPPPAVTAGELVLNVVGVGYVAYGSKVYDQNRVHEPLMRAAA